MFLAGEIPEKHSTIIAITAAALLASPYTPYYTSIILLILDIPLWFYVFAFNGYLPTSLGTRLAWNATALLPAGVLLWLYWPVVKAGLGEGERESLASLTPSSLLRSKNIHLPSKMENLRKFY